MQPDKENVKDSRSALNFLIEANILSNEGIVDVPNEFVDKHLKLVETFNLKSKKEIASHDLKFFINEAKADNGPGVPTKRWTHKSVVKMMEESDYADPITEMKRRARQTVLLALSKGWNGPPYDAIELAKILEHEIAPNDEIADARTVPLNKGKFRIEYNPFQKTTRLNFSIGHEIAHTFFTDCYQEIRNREENPEANRQLEQLCNIGASELQLPYVIFPADANNLEEITIEGILDLAKKYKASLESFLLAFVDAVDRPCAVMICTFLTEDNLVMDYSKRSSRFEINIPDGFRLPSDSKGYYCNVPGTTQRETVQWPFMDRQYDVFYIGISPMRRERKPRIAIVVVPNDGKGKLQNRRIQIEFGDATKPKGKGLKVIAQVVNTSAGLGIGFGKSLSMNYPEVKTALKEWKARKQDFRLGNSQLLQVRPDIYVFQMLAQNGMKPKNDETLLDYPSLKTCLAELRDTAKELNADVYMPLIGSGQARGKWEIIEGLVYSELVNQDVNVTIYLFGSPKADEFRPRSTMSSFNLKSTWQKEK
ncbi:ImmA/IrrE family metallo-endopeptidase [Flavihumibacter sp. CACIAM 22H1]|uniref:ImmA/IrrE family metallo-endopeptidase n=1 Tax=Flavihumibacter sp. CACIAM 22H1 TaxID=1812911 RepID=UPI0007A90255|nr:ImmA/IrrE family metallo-endopeptidase [Flavihumibacter sp. CACIAM 22H1]KYP13498.1 MAG: hypothetical protein A1D16_12795 [Flavihumibacter sp. CACIAM 22H1]